MAIINLNFLAQKLDFKLLMKKNQNTRRDFLKKVCPTVAFAFFGLSFIEACSSSEDSEVIENNDNNQNNNETNEFGYSVNGSVITIDLTNSNFSSLNNVEHVRKLLVVDQIFHLSHLKKIDQETAIFLVRQYLDKSFYEQLIGRNINFRIEDETSIFQEQGTFIKSDFYP